MRILVVTPTYLPIVGGAETGIYEIFRRLQGQHSVRILTPQISRPDLANFGATDAFYQEQVLPVRRFRDWLTTGKGSWKRHWERQVPPLSLSYLSALSREIAAFQPDLINFHYLFPGALALLWARRFKKIPVVLSLVSRSDVFGHDNYLFRFHRRWMLRTAAAADAGTALTGYMLQQHPFGDEVQVIPYGADLNRFHPANSGVSLRARLGIPPEACVLFTLQRLTPLKRVDLLIRSAADLALRMPALRLMIGGQGPEEAILKDLARRLDLAERVIFTGFIPETELPEYMAAADLFVFASQSETFGIVLAQALAAGRPVVAFGSTCLKEVVQNEVDGLLVPEEDPDALTAAILRLAADPLLRAEFGRQGRQNAEQRFDWNRIAAQYADLFERVRKQAKISRED